MMLSMSRGKTSIPNVSLLGAGNQELGTRGEGTPVLFPQSPNLNLPLPTPASDLCRKGGAYCNPLERGLPPRSGEINT